jgi:ankyrin repeat protein
MVNADRNGNTLLHFAAAGDNVALIDSLIKCGLEINAQNKLGQTPLHIAYKHGKLETSLLLIRYSADTNIRDNDGNIPSKLDTSEM